MTTEAAPPGWYHGEGDAPGTIRYWSGEEWKTEPLLPAEQASPQKPAVTLTRLLSPRGRVNRTTFAVVASAVVVASLIALALDGLLATPRAGVYGPAFLVVAIATLWPTLATAAKRAHDLGWSAGWLAFGFIPVYGQLVLFVMLACIRGNQADNRHGPVPPTAFAL